MRSIAVVVTRDYTDERGDPHVVGEVLTVDPVQAVILLNRKRARFMPKSRVVEADPPRRRRTYRRRDLTAEP